MYTISMQWEKITIVDFAMAMSWWRRYFFLSKIGEENIKSRFTSVLNTFFFLNNCAEFQADRSIGEKKPRVLGDEEPSMTELSGYNFKRQEFEIEYDNDAEQILADMEFRDTDGDAERELKLRVLRIYSKR